MDTVVAKILIGGDENGYMYPHSSLRPDVCPVCKNRIKDVPNLGYKVKRKSRGLIVLNNNIWDNDTFSISPYSSNVKFPIYLRTPNEKYNFNLIGGIKNVKIETCNYRKLEKHEYTNM